MSTKDDPQYMSIVDIMAELGWKPSGKTSDLAILPYDAAAEIAARVLGCDGPDDVEFILARQGRTVRVGHNRYGSATCRSMAGYIGEG